MFCDTQSVEMMLPEPASVQGRRDHHFSTYPKYHQWSEYFKEDLISSSLKNVMVSTQSKVEHLGFIRRGTGTTKGENQSVCLVHQLHSAQTPSLINNREKGNRRSLHSQKMFYKFCLFVCLFFSHHSFSPYTSSPFSWNISAFGLPEENANVSICSFKYLTNFTDPLLVLGAFPLASTFWNCLKV